MNRKVLFSPRVFIFRNFRPGWDDLRPVGHCEFAQRGRCRPERKSGWRPVHQRARVRLWHESESLGRACGNRTVGRDERRYTEVRFPLPHGWHQRKVPRAFFQGPEELEASQHRAGDPGRSYLPASRRARIPVTSLSDTFYTLEVSVVSALAGETVCPRRIGSWKHVGRHRAVSDQGQPGAAECRQRLYFHAATAGQFDRPDTEHVEVSLRRGCVARCLHRVDEE